MPKIIISKVKEQDILEVKKLLRETWENTYGSWLTQETINKITSVWHDPKNLLKQAQDKNTYFAVAKNEQKKIVGIITARKIDQKLIFLDRLYIDSDWQGRGIGTKLFEEVIKTFSKFKIIRLEIEKPNKKARKFYEKIGFKSIGEKDDAFEGEVMRVVVMEKKI